MNCVHVLANGPTDEHVDPSGLYLSWQQLFFAYSRFKREGSDQSLQSLFDGQVFKWAKIEWRPLAINVPNESSCRLTRIMAIKLLDFLLSKSKAEYYEVSLLQNALREKEWIKWHLEDLGYKPLPDCQQKTVFVESLKTRQLERLVAAEVQSVRPLKTSLISPSTHDNAYHLALAHLSAPFSILDSHNAKHFVRAELRHVVIEAMALAAGSLRQLQQARMGAASLLESIISQNDNFSIKCRICDLQALGRSIFAITRVVLRQRCGSGTFAAKISEEKDDEGFSQYLLTLYNPPIEKRIPDDIILIEQFSSVISSGCIHSISIENQKTELSIKFSS